MKCQRKCSDICVQCKWPCIYQCPHYSCTRKCSEFCDRPPCYEPCPKTIRKCGHPCIGFCGEPCPKLCRICDNPTIAKILKKEDRNARFVYLEDCGHCIESSTMENLMESHFNVSSLNRDENNNVLFDLPKCPVCSKPIQRSMRYSNYLKSRQVFIKRLKLKQYGNPKENIVILQKLKSQAVMNLYTTKSDVKSVFFCYLIFIIYVTNCLFFNLENESV